MLIEKIIEFEFRSLGPLALQSNAGLPMVHVLLYLVNFMTKQKSFRKTFSVDYYLAYC